MAGPGRYAPAMRHVPFLLMLSTGCSRENAFTIGTEVYDTGCALPPVLDAGPELLWMGSAGPADQPTQTFRLSNTGEATLGIAWAQQMANGVGDDDAFAVTVSAGPGAEPATDDGLAWVLPAQAALDVQVTFTPRHDGLHWGGIVVATDASDDARLPEDPHMARQAARGRVVFKAEGRGMGGSEPDVFLLGGIHADSHAVEPGGTVRLEWDAHDPDGRYPDAQRTYLRDQEGDLHEVSTWRQDWTAPTEEPTRDGFARTATFSRTHADGRTVDANTPIFIWPTAGLSAPICP